MQENKQQIKSPWIKGMLAGFGAMALAIILFLFLYKFRSLLSVLKSVGDLLMPFIIGAAIAYLLSPACNRFEALFGRLMPRRKGASGALAILASMIILLLIIYLLIIMIIPQMYTSIVSLANTLPGKVEKLVSEIDDKLKDNETLLRYLSSAYEAIKSSFSSWVNQKLLPDMANIIGGVGSGVLSVVNVFKNIVIGLIVAVYCLAGRKIFAVQAKKILYSLAGKKWGDIISGEAKYADRMFSGFLSGKLVDSAIIGALCYLFCAIASMPNALLISVVIGVTNIIPFFGPFIGAIPMAFLILIENPMKSFWFVIFIIILQQIDGNIIGPKILGDSTGLSSFWILFAIIIFGGWFGFIGMIIGVPLFAVIYDIVKKLVHRGLVRKEIPAEVLSGKTE